MELKSGEGTVVVADRDRVMDRLFQMEALPQIQKSLFKILYPL